MSQTIPAGAGKAAAGAKIGLMDGMRDIKGLEDVSGKSPGHSSADRTAVKGQIMTGAGRMSSQTKALVGDVAEGDVCAVCSKLLEAGKQALMMMATKGKANAKGMKSDMRREAGTGVEPGQGITGMFKNMIAAAVSPATNPDNSRDNDMGMGMSPSPGQRPGMSR